MTRTIVIEVAGAEIIGVRGLRDDEQIEMRQYDLEAIDGHYDGEDEGGVYRVMTRLTPAGEQVRERGYA